MGHEVVDGASRFWSFQTFIRAQGVPEGIYNTDLFKINKINKDTVKRMKLYNSIFKDVTAATYLCLDSV